MAHVIVLLPLIFLTVDSNKATRNIQITAEEEKLRDIEGYQAIKAIHAILDDDKSGSIDRYESADFLAEDLKFGESEREKREKSFHGNDESITVEELWEAWFQSDEREWNQKQVVDWLVNTVKLPQYANNFMNEKVTGIHLPRMAVQNSTYLSTLGIKNYVHRQKIQLKALDLVLFGSYDSSSLLKDIALACLLAILITVLIFFKTHRSRSKKQMDELSTRLSKLRDMETDFEGVEQKMIEENGRKQSMDDNSETMARVQELEVERERIPDVNGFDGLPFPLQNLLRRTYEMESTYLNQQKLECLHEMREAKELVDKMRRKQTSIINSIKLATGATSGTGDIDTKIFNLKTRMEKIKMAMEELNQRWVDIENHCGFSIAGPFRTFDDNNHLLLKPANKHIVPLQIPDQVSSSFDVHALAEPFQNDALPKPNVSTISPQRAPVLVQNGKLHSTSNMECTDNNNQMKNSQIGCDAAECASMASLTSSVQTNKKGVGKLRQLFRRKPKS